MTATEAPPISVLLSTFNDERFLAEAIDSILDQTMPDFEFVIVDDASSDGTPEIIQRYAKRDARITVLRNAENLGLTKSLNRGLRSAKGRYVARMDGDDVSAPSRFERQYAYLENHPGCHFLSTEGVVIGEHGKTLLKIRTDPATATRPDRYRGALPYVHSSMMLRREALLALGGYDEKFPTRQDLDLWLRALRAGFVIDVLQEDLIYRRHHLASLSHDGFDNLYMNMSVRLMHWAHDNDREVPFDDIRALVGRTPAVERYVRGLRARHLLKAAFTGLIGWRVIEGGSLAVRALPLAPALLAGTTLERAMDAAMTELESHGRSGAALP